MDTRFWGPSGWQLLHYISFHSNHPEQFLLGIKDILPCRFCRESTTEYQHTIQLKNPERWVYELHNKVNNKLRLQHKDDTSVIDPGSDPSFEEVKAKYEKMKLTDVLGRDFLFSIAVNYPMNPKPSQMATQRVFLKQLAEVYPLKSFKSFHLQNEPTLESQLTYMRWMYNVLKSISNELGVSLPSYQKYSKHVLKYKSGCSKKKYRGKTCRKKGGGSKRLKRLIS